MGAAAPGDPAARRLWRWAWKGAVSVGLLALLVATQDLGGVFRVVAAADPAWLVLATAVMLVEQALTAWTWGLLLRARKLGVGTATVFHVYFVSSFVGTWLPSSSGPDVVRAWYLSREVDGYESVGSMLVLRFISLLALGGFALGGMAVAATEVPPSAAVLAALLAAGSAGALAVGFTEAPRRWATAILRSLRLDPLARILGRLHGALHAYRRAGRVLLVTLAVSTLVQLLRIATIWAGGVALGATVPFHHYLVLVPVTMVVQLLPVSIAGFGVREGSFVFFFGRVGMSDARAFGLGLLVFALTLLLWAIGAILYWRGAPRTDDAAATPRDCGPPATFRDSGSSVTPGNPGEPREPGEPSPPGVPPGEGPQEPGS